MNSPNISRFIPRGLILTQEQTAIQLAQNKVVIIDANAGAAKTTTLAIRIGEAVARNLAPELILALVFTPEARDVMRQRLLDVGIPYATAVRIEVATFEDFASKALMKIDGGDTKRCPRAKDLKKYVLAAIEQVSRHYCGKVEFLDLRTHNIAISQFLDLQLELKATLALDGDFEFMGLEEVAEILNVPLTDYLTTREYERIRLGSSEETLFRGPFDATYDLARNLSLTPELAQDFPAYRVIVCDELHDLNEAAFKILNALLNRPQCYFVGAGDKDQVIHSKLGASHEYLERRFAQSYPGQARYPLTLSYRYGPRLAYAMAEFKQKTVDSSLPLQTQIKQSHYEATAEACAGRVVEAILQWKSEKLPLDGCAILIRDRHQSVFIENALLKAQISYRTQEMAGYLQREEILFLRGMIAIALKNLASVKSYEVRTAIVEALSIFGEVELSPQQIEQAKYAVAKDPESLNNFFGIRIKRGDGERESKQIEDMVEYVKSVPPDTMADVVLREICTQMHLEEAAKRIFVRPYDASVVSKSIAGFLAAAANSGLNLRDFSESLNAAEAFATRKREKTFVTLECVANAKGKEFDHVIMPFLEVDEFPHPMCGRMEEENLFYVGATRAKSRLTLISPLDEEKRSPFIRQMKLASSLVRANTAVRTNEAQASALPPSRHDLKVPYAERGLVKALGADWDSTRKIWYVKVGVDMKPFAHWLRT
ncbi:MAG: ATP-dependent helicase [Oxalobacteraceae bacterium]|nr:ATP-dependent helicase [Oxalobacteraceae bacterium]